MGSAVFKSPDVQNKIEDQLRQKTIASREFKIDLRTDSSKRFDLDRELLGAFSKLTRKRSSNDAFDSIVPDEKQRASQPNKDGLVMIFCKDNAKRHKIKCTLLRMFQNSETIRWPNFQMADDQNSLFFGVRESMCDKVIGYTSFFLFYGVIPEKNLSLSQMETDINRTVQYFNEYHKGALGEVEKFFIFELPSEASELCKMEESESGTIFVVSNDKDHLEALAKVAENDMLENGTSVD